LGVLRYRYYINMSLLGQGEDQAHTLALEGVHPEFPASIVARIYVDNERSGEGEAGQGTLTSPPQQKSLSARPTMRITALECNGGGSSTPPHPTQCHT
jgi:hypothetical protein